MNNPKLVEAVEVMREASNSAWSAYWSAWSSVNSACDSACDSAELNKKAVLKIIKEKYEKSKIS